MHQLKNSGLNPNKANNNLGSSVRNQQRDQTSGIENNKVGELFLKSCKQPTVTENLIFSVSQEQKQSLLIEVLIPIPNRIPI